MTTKFQDTVSDEIINEADEYCNNHGENEIQGEIQIRVQEWIDMQEELKFTKMMLESMTQKYIGLEEENEALKLRILHSGYGAYDDNDSYTEE